MPAGELREVQRTVPHLWVGVACAVSFRPFARDHPRCARLVDHGPLAGKPWLDVVAWRGGRASGLTIDLSVSGAVRTSSESTGPGRPACVMAQRSWHWKRAGVRAKGPLPRAISAEELAPGGPRPRSISSRAWNCWTRAAGSGIRPWAASRRGAAARLGVLLDDQSQMRGFLMAIAAAGTCWAFCRVAPTSSARFIRPVELARSARPQTWKSLLRRDVVPTVWVERTWLGTDARVNYLMVVRKAS